MTSALLAARGLRAELQARSGLTGPYQWGVVNTINTTSPPALDVFLDGASVVTPKILYLASYSPKVGDVVLVGRLSGPAKNSRIVLGTIAPGPVTAQTPGLFDEVLVGTTITAPATTVSFPQQMASFPQNFRTLTVDYIARDNSITNGQTLMTMRINNDATAGAYAGDRITSTANVAGGQDQVAATSGSVGISQGGGSAASCVGAGRITIPLFSRTTFFKQWHSIGGDTAANHSVDAFGGFWQNTAAITSLTFMLAGGAQFVSGSWFLLSFS